MAKKMDRFGWDRDRGTMAHDRMITDWMDALQQYPLNEVKAACRRYILDNPKQMPNEGHVIAMINTLRKVARELMPKPTPLPPPKIVRVTADQTAAIMAEIGFKPKLW